MKPAVFAAPPLNLLLREIRVLADLYRGGRIGPALRTDHDGQGHNVMVVPGFLAADGSTLMLRRTLNAANYRSHGWGLGRNFGIRGDILRRIDRRMDAVQRINPGPATLIGWSLGGLIAREYAKYAPDRVARVITLGTPFSGDLRANHAWRIYELIAGHRVDSPPLAVKLTEKPPVPTYAIWSRNDGVVDRHCARGLPHESDVTIEVGCGHMGFTTAPDSIAAIFRALQT
ncbi:MAG: alpha/beta hydrolase [Alphaproteobacteria bacterium]|nr:alpha/beta hydrolase [Alphaproteobacteria bacterium]